jgi:hypothetical protein
VIIPEFGILKMSIFVEFGMKEGNFEALEQMIPPIMAPWAPSQVYLTTAMVSSPRIHP